MLHIDLALDEARDRQAALRHPVCAPRASSRPNAVRRLLGVWIVRLGWAVAGGRAAAARLA
jgi:hypothetical protein